MIGEDTLIRFSGCKAGEACTIVLRGARCVTPPPRGPKLFLFVDDLTAVDFSRPFHIGELGCLRDE